MYVDSNSGKVKKTVGKVKKPEKAKGKITFKLNISGHPEYAQGKFAIGIKKSKSAYSVISPKSYVSNPEKLSTNTAAYFVPGTKKGIQATDINELTDTKSKTVFFNLYISDLMRKDSGVETYKYNGKTYHFNGLYGYVYLVQQCNAKGIQVTAQISIDRNASTQSFITGNSPYAETAYYGWNTDNSTTRQTMEAMFAYLGEKFGKNNCYISNWILGNEVNSASGYYYVVVEINMINMMQETYNLAPQSMVIGNFVDGVYKTIGEPRGIISEGMSDKGGIRMEYQQERNIKLCYVAADEYIDDNLVVKCKIEDRNKYKGEVPYLVIGSEE